MAIHFTKTVYDPPESQDGFRLIIMRRYPRGIAKSRAHAWVPQLAPTLPLVHWYHGNKRAIETRWRSRDPVRFEREIAKFWKTYSRRYLSEMRGHIEGKRVETITRKGVALSYDGERFLLPP